MLTTTPLIIIVGLIIGVVVAAPVGPVNVLCIQRTLQRGFWGGVAAGFGAVLGDGLLAATAAFGINAISWIFNDHKTEVQIIGGLLLIAFGVHLFFRRPVMFDSVDEATRLSYNAAAIPQSFFLTVTNPGAFLFIFAIFGNIPVWIGHLDAIGTFVLVLAVVAGSAAWWCGLSWLISIIRHQLTESRLGMINQISAGILICFGLSLLGEMAWQYYVA